MKIKKLSGLAAALICGAGLAAARSWAQTPAQVGTQAQASAAGEDGGYAQYIDERKSGLAQMLERRVSAIEQRAQEQEGLLRQQTQERVGFERKLSSEEGSFLESLKSMAPQARSQAWPAFYDRTHKEKQEFYARLHQESHKFWQEHFSRMPKSQASGLKKGSAAR